MGVNQSNSNPDLVTVSQHHHHLVYNHPHHHRVNNNKLNRSSTLFTTHNSNSMESTTTATSNVKSSTTNTFGLRQRYYHNQRHPSSTSQRRHQQAATVVAGAASSSSTNSVMMMADDDIIADNDDNNNNFMQRHSAHFIDEINTNSLSSSENNDDNDELEENYNDDDDEEIDNDNDDDNDDEEEDAHDQSNYGFLTSHAQQQQQHRYSVRQQLQQSSSLHDESTTSFVATNNQAVMMDRVVVKKPKKFNKLFKLISSGSSQKASKLSEKKTITEEATATVRVRDPERVVNRKKNNLFAKSLVLISSAKSRFNLHEKETANDVEFNKEESGACYYVTPQSSIHNKRSMSSSTTTKLASKFRQISERISATNYNSNKASAVDLHSNNQTDGHKQKQQHKSSTGHHSCSTSSGCSSGASSSNLSSTRRLSSKMSQNMLSSSTNSILSSNIKLTTPATAELCSTPTPPPLDHSISYRNNSYLNGLNGAGSDETTMSSSSVKYSKSMVVISPAMYSLDKSSNATSLNSSELNDIHLGVVGRHHQKSSASRAPNRKGDELKSKSMYAENEFMRHADDDQEEESTVEYHDDKRRRGATNSNKKLSKMDYFKSRLSLKFSKAGSKSSASKSSRQQESSASSRDSGIFTDLFSHLGSMGNLRGRLSNATESLRQSFSVFNLKAASSASASSLSHSDVAKGTQSSSRRRKTLKECNDAYFADNNKHSEHSAVRQPVAIQSEILHHTSANLNEANMLNQIAEIVSNADYHFGQSEAASVMMMQPPVSTAMMVRPSSFKSILKRGASISSATTSSSCGTTESTGGAGGSSSNNYDSQLLSQLSSTTSSSSSSSNSFSNYVGTSSSCNLKRTTTFHSTTNAAHPAAASASSHNETSRQMSSTSGGVVCEDPAAALHRVLNPTTAMMQHQVNKTTTSSLIDQTNNNNNNNHNRLVTPSSMAAVNNNAAKYSMMSNKSGSTSGTTNGHKHQKIVVQASTNDLLRCLIAYLSKECSHLIRLDPTTCEVGSSSKLMNNDNNNNNESKFKISSLDIINWLRAPDRILLLQGWQDVAFMNPVNVVFVYMLVRDSMKPSQLRCAFDLQCSLMSCLYLAFSYMGNEISYPLKPFLIEDDRDVFWQRQLKLMSELSPQMLRINREPRFFTELFYELKSYSAVSDKSIILDNSTWLRHNPGVVMHPSHLANTTTASHHHHHVHKSITMNSLSKFSSSQQQQQPQQQSKPPVVVVSNNNNNSSTSSFGEMTSKQCSVCMDGKVLPIVHGYSKQVMMGGATATSGGCYFANGGDFSKPIAYCI